MEPPGVNGNKAELYSHSVAFPHSVPVKEGILQKARKEFRGTVLSAGFTQGSLGPSHNMLHVSLAYLYQRLFA